MAETKVALEALMPFVEERLAEGGSVAFSPRGTSMLPMLHQGRDTVTLSAITGELKPFDLPLYRRENGAYVLHRIVAVGETYTCIGDNQFQEEPGLRKEQMLAVVTAFTHKGRSYSVEDWRYRLYCRFWHHSRGLRRIWRGVRRRLSWKR